MASSSTLKAPTAIPQHKDEEEGHPRDGADDVSMTGSDMELKRKALFRSVLLLLTAGIITITVGALLTRFDRAFQLQYPSQLRIPKGFSTPFHDNDNNNNDGVQNISRSNFKPVTFRRDPSDYVLSTPNWSGDNIQPRIREYDWVVSDVTANPDGVMRPMVLINGQFPGPLIECNENDIVRVTIYNRAINATSFHWHGLFHNGSNWMDGTTGVTQCPIPPGERFTYEFNTTGQYGTYWYHSHFSTQYTDGLFGPLVIHSPREPGINRYKTDQIVMLHDHYHDLSRNKLYKYMAPDGENEEPIPDGALINGRNTTETQLAEIHTPSGSSHRLRFINVGAFAEFELGLDEHTLEVIEADGTALAPSTYHKLNINVAQRYSVIVNANSTTASEFWLRARMINHCFSKPNAVAESEVRAVVRYSASSILQTKRTASGPTDVLPFPTTQPWDGPIALICKDLDGKLEPAIPTPAPDPDMFFYIRSNFEIGNYSLSRGFFNSSTWKRDLRNPALNRVSLQRNKVPKELEPEGVMHDLFNAAKGMVLKVDGIKVVDLLIDNYDDGNHPMHLHGHKFWVMASGRGYFNMSDYHNLPQKGRLVRDTVTLGKHAKVQRLCKTIR
ncbi:Laccase-4 [Arthrobotrys entomopaga]|nr:Laccase-4 [Arthrobotrys entomopaga]